MMCSMKRRVTLMIEEIPFKALRVMAATENISMSSLVEEFVMGERQNVTGKKEIKKILKENNLEVDNSKESVLKSPKEGLDKKRGELNGEDYI